MRLKQLWLKFKKRDRFHIHPQYFPENTRTLIPTAVMLKFGAIALGMKDGGILNVGLIDVLRLDARDALSLLALEHGKRPHFFEVSASDFLQTLRMHYGIDTERLKTISDIDPKLKYFLNS